MSPLEKEIARQRDHLLNVELEQTETLNRAYAPVAARLQQHLDALVRQIENAERAGTEVRPGWLFAQARYRQLIADLREHTDAFLAKAALATSDGQRAAVQAAFEDGKRLARLALGPAPSTAGARLTNTWDRLPTAALDLLVGRASDGGPLAWLLNEIAPLAPERVRDTLAFGVAAGKNPRRIAAEVQQAATITRHRALVIARTEIVGAHREAKTQTWKQTGIVQQWQWVSAKDRRTCAACWAMDGTLHSVDETMQAHPQCRCTKVPRTPSWEDLGFTGIPDRRPVLPTGKDVFERLTQADKLAVLGRAKLEAYNAGDITLPDLVARSHSPRWGTSVRVASLSEALA